MTTKQESGRLTTTTIITTIKTTINNEIHGFEEENMDGPIRFRRNKTTTLWDWL
jgi:hypothetical protein